MRAFYDTYSGYLTAVCRRYVSNDEAGDILQDSFMKIFAAAPGFEHRGEGSLRAWAARIVVNEALKYLKRRKRLRPAAEVGRLADVADEGDPDVESVPTALIMEAIRSLPDGYRTVFNLYVFEEKSHREIAALLDIAESSSASQLHRARIAISKRIKEYGSKKRQNNG